MITWKSIWQILLKHKRSLIWGQGVTIVAILISIPIPLMLPVLVDEVLLNKPAHVVDAINGLFGSGTPLYYIGVVLITAIMLRLLFFLISILQIKIFTAIAKFVTFEIRHRLIVHLERVAMNEYETIGSGAVGANLVTDVNTLDSFIANSASKLVSSILTIIAVAVVMIMIHPLLGVLIIVFQPLVMLVTKRISKNVGKLKAHENAAIEAFQDDVGEVLELFGQIKASNKESYFFSRLIEKAKNIQRTSNQFGYKSVAAERFSFTLFLSVFEILRATGLVMVVYSDLSIGMMFAMFGYIWFIMTPVQEILSMQYSFASASAALKRINKILELESEPQGEKILKPHQGGIDIELKNLAFSYDGQEMVLADLSMQIKAGQKIAIIGSSGSGKTTLAQVIAGFYPKSGGELLYNDIPIHDLKRQSLRAGVFLVLQMPILFNDTLRFNVTMGALYEDEQILKALEMAQMKTVVDGMKSGLDTIVGRHGIRLSGGQRQRLAIARMILADPDVVIFDESTSALDVHTEAKLFEVLTPLLKQKTVITIAHRLSTVTQADTIFVLESGHIVEQGTHDELEEKLGHYYQFLKSQKV